MNFPLAFIEGIGGPELLMIMFVILLLFGANRLPELAKGLGKSVKEFKKAAAGVEDEVRRAIEEAPPPAKKPAAAAATVPASGTATLPAPPVTPDKPADPTHPA